MEHVEQFANRVLAFERVAQRRLVDDLVVVTPADLLAMEVPGVFQIVKDSLHRPGSDADDVTQVTLTKIGITAQRHHDMGVIGEKRP